LLEKGVDIKPILDILKDEKAVANSKQFPFRFFSAYKELEHITTPASRRASEALQTALELSVKNIPRLDGTTYIATDNSSSMSCSMSAMSSVTMNDVGNLMGAMALHFSDDAIASVFGSQHRVVRLNKRDSILTNAQKLIGTNVGHSTDAYLAFDYLLDNEVRVDRILIFSDMQCYDSFGGGASLAQKFSDYKRRVNKNARLYSFDLAGYGTIQWPEDENNVYLFAGFSDKVFKLIKIAEDGTDPLDMISKYDSTKRGSIEE
jgi:hypothetical protein